jgi:hypothetical protein
MPDGDMSIEPIAQILTTRMTEKQILEFLEDISRLRHKRCFPTGGFCKISLGRVG